MAKERVTLLQAARMHGYKTAKSFRKNYIETGVYKFHEDELPNGRIRLLIDLELIEKRLQKQYQYQLVRG